VDAFDVLADVLDAELANGSPWARIARIG